MTASTLWTPCRVSCSADFLTRFPPTNTLTSFSPTTTITTSARGAEGLQTNGEREDAPLELVASENTVWCSFLEVNGAEELSWSAVFSSTGCPFIRLISHQLLQNPEKVGLFFIKYLR